MRSFVVGLLIFSVGCASTAKDPKRWWASEPVTEYEKAMASFGVHAFSANLHAHHFMGYKSTKKFKGQNLNATGNCADAQTFAQDDGRPCRQTPAGPNMIVPAFNKNKSQPAMQDYFQMACDYAREQGQLDIMFITPHTKNNQKNQDQNQSDADSRAEEIAIRHQMLKSINDAYEGTFVCGLGQEASSITAGNHLGIFGQFRADNAAETKPFFFPTGQFDVLYPEVKRRAAAGEKIILQMNHPNSASDLWMGDISGDDRRGDSKWLKENLNDYGMDDFQPVACLLRSEKCAGATQLTDVTEADIRATYQAMRDASGDRFRLIEIVPTGGATSNPGIDFAPVHNRKYAYDFTEDKQRKGEFENAKALLYDYIHYLAMGFKLGPVANQDNHHMNFGTAGASRTGILATQLTEDAVLTAMDMRRTFASEDKNAKVLFFTEAGGAKTLMGGEASTSAATAKIVVGYQDPDPDDQEVMVRVYYYRVNEPLNFEHRALRSDTVRLITFKGERGTLPLASIAVQTLNDKGFSVVLKSGELKTLEIPLEMGGQYAFVEVTQSGDLDKAWTAPVWLNRVAPQAQ